MSLQQLRAEEQQQDDAPARCRPARVASPGPGARRTQEPHEQGDHPGQHDEHHPDAQLVEELQEHVVRIALALGRRHALERAGARAAQRRPPGEVGGLADTAPSARCSRAWSRARHRAPEPLGRDLGERHGRHDDQAGGDDQQDRHHLARHAKRPGRGGGLGSAMIRPRTGPRDPTAAAVKTRKTPPGTDPQRAQTCPPRPASSRQPPRRRRTRAARPHRVPLAAQLEPAGLRGWRAGQRHGGGHERQHDRPQNNRRRSRVPRSGRTAPPWRASSASRSGWPPRRRSRTPASSRGHDEHRREDGERRHQPEWDATGSGAGEAIEADGGEQDAEHGNVASNGSALRPALSGPRRTQTNSVRSASGSRSKKPATAAAEPGSPAPSAPSVATAAAVTIRSPRGKGDCVRPGAEARRPNVRRTRVVMPPRANLYPNRAWRAGRSGKSDAVLSLERLALADCDWRAMDAFPDRVVFQTREWLEFLARTQRAEPVVAAVVDDGEHVGYFTGPVIRRFGCASSAARSRVGRPSRWGSTSPRRRPARRRGRAGPVRVGRSAARISSSRTAGSQPADLEGLGSRPLTLTFRGRPGRPTRRPVFGRMSSACRRAVRKGEKSGVTVSGDRRRVRGRVLRAARGRFRPPVAGTAYGVERVRALIDCLEPTGRLLLCARAPVGRQRAQEEQPAGRLQALDQGAYALDPVGGHQRLAREDALELRVVLVRERGPLTASP